MSSAEQLSEKWNENLVNQTEKLIPETLVRGRAPDEIRKRCIELCRRYLAIDQNGGQSIIENEFDVRRLTGGLTNQLYFVGFKQRTNGNIHNDNIKAVTIKFYQSKHFKQIQTDVCDTGNERLNDTIISIIMSERKIGPKIYGAFPGGIIQSHHEHEQFRCKHQQNEKLLRKVAHRLAELNNLEIPIEKDRYGLLKILYRYIHDGYRQMDLERLAGELNLSNLNENDFLQEIDWAFEFFMKKHQCPTVFCHNDFRGNNIMVEKDTEEIILCDFEYSSYGPRGYDIASFLIEWDREFLDFRTFNLPSRDVLEMFVGFYLEGCDLVKPGYLLKPENSVSKLIQEIYIGFLLVLTCYLGFLLNQPEAVIGNIPYDINHRAAYVNIIFKYFLMMKDKLIEEKILTN